MNHGGTGNGARQAVEVSRELVVHFQGLNDPITNSMTQRFNGPINRYPRGQPGCNARLWDRLSARYAGLWEGHILSFRQAVFCPEGRLSPPGAYRIRNRCCLAAALTTIIINTIQDPNQLAPLCQMGW